MISVNMVRRGDTRKEWPHDVEHEALACLIARLGASSGHVLPKHVCSIEKVKVFLKESSTFEELEDRLRKEGNGNGEGRGNGHGHGMVDVTELSTSHPWTCQLLVDYAQMARPGFMFTSSL